VKYHLVSQKFRPADGWSVNVHLDPMEICQGGSHTDAKREAAQFALDGLERLGVTLGFERSYRADILAEHEAHGRFLIEAKGTGSQQKELAFYSALGQLVTKVGEPPWALTPALALPDQPRWERQACKLPKWLLHSLRLQVFLVSATGIRSL